MLRKPLLCPHCNAENDPGAFKCTVCGRMMDGASTFTDISLDGVSWTDEAYNRRLGRKFIGKLFRLLFTAVALACGVGLLALSPNPRPIPPRESRFLEVATGKLGQLEAGRVPWVEFTPQEINTIFYTQVVIPLLNAHTRAPARVPPPSITDLIVKDSAATIVLTKKILGTRRQIFASVRVGQRGNRIIYEPRSVSMGYLVLPPQVFDLFLTDHEKYFLANALVLPWYVDRVELKRSNAYIYGKRY